MLRYFCSEMWKFQLCGKRTFLFLHMDLISFSWRFIHVRNSSVPRQGLYTNRRSLKKRYLFSLFTSHRTFLCFIFSDQRNSVWKKKRYIKISLEGFPKTHLMLEVKKVFHIPTSGCVIITSKKKSIAQRKMWLA